MKKNSKGANHAAPQDLSPWSKNHGRELCEKEHNLKLIKAEELSQASTYGKDFLEKIKDLARYGNIDSVALIGTYPRDLPISPHHFRVYFYTNDNEYCIVAKFVGYAIKGSIDDPNHDAYKESYLGCTVKTRKNRPGETWHRGNDLPDGKYCTQTWNDILNGILRYEIKTLQI